MKIARYWKDFAVAGARVVGGILFTICALALFAALSDLSLSRDRLVNVTKEALATDQLDFSGLERDLFTECSLLTMSYLRHDSSLLNIVDTKFSWGPGKYHPCESLEILINNDQPEGIVGPYSYLNYPWGSRHLQELVLGQVNYSTARSVYSFLSYFSIVFMLLSAFRNSPSIAMLLAPVGAFLLFAFELTTFGDNLGHAPGYFVGFTGLGVFLLATDRFRKSSQRFVFFGIVATLVAYFDILTGSLHVILSLSILLNHFFYVRERHSFHAYWSQAASQAVGIFGCFVLAYAMLTVIRMIAVSPFQTGGFYDFWHLMDYTKPGTGVPGISLRDLVSAYWLNRHRLTGSGFTAAWLLGASALTWGLALIGIFTLLVKRGAISHILAVDLLVLLTAGGGIILWYILFQGHSLTHVFFMVRMIALPASYGFVALTLVAQAFWEKLPVSTISVTVGGVLVLFALPANIETGVCLLGRSPPDVSLARLSSKVTDKVSCAVLGLYSDGAEDGLVELKYRNPSTSMTWLGLRAPTHITLEITDPPAAYETGSSLYVIGINAKPRGKLLNRSDGRFIAPSIAGADQHLWAHFCGRTGEKPETIYTVRVTHCGVSRSRRVRALR